MLVIPIVIVIIFVTRSRSGSRCPGGFVGVSGPACRLGAVPGVGAGGDMVLFTVFATIDSLALLFAMSGMLACSIGALKFIADLEHDLSNASDFASNMRRVHKAEYVFIAMSLVSGANDHNVCF